MILLGKNSQTKESRGKVPLLRVFPPCRWEQQRDVEKLASGPQAHNYPDRSRSTIAGVCKQEHVCRFCNMQQSPCNCISPGVSRLQQSGVFFFCQLWQIFTRNESDDLRNFKCWTGGASVKACELWLDVVIPRNALKWSQLFVPCSLMGRSERRALPRIKRME